MYFNMIEASNATDAFVKAYRYVDHFGEIVESRIGKTKHLVDMNILIKNPYNNVCLDRARNLSLRYMLGEILWYLSGSNKVKDIAKYAKMWNDLTDDGETVNSAYGYRIFHQFGFDQLQYVIDKLKKNPYDRQAVIHIKDASDKPTKDTPCTCLIQFTCYQKRLNAHVYMRSNDIWLGLPYDVAFFTVLQQIVSNEVGISCGEYWHTVGDLHLYEKHWNKGIGMEYTEDINDLGFHFCAYTQHELERVRDGEEPTNMLLRKLWRMNNEHRKN